MGQLVSNARDKSEREREFFYTKQNMYMTSFVTKTIYRHQTSKHIKTKWKLIFQTITNIQHKSLKHTLISIFSFTTSTRNFYDFSKNNQPFALSRLFQQLENQTNLWQTHFHSAFPFRSTPIRQLIVKILKGITATALLNGWESE